MTTRYEQLQQALIAYRQDARAHTSERFERCAMMIRQLGLRLRADLGLAPDAEYEVFFYHPDATEIRPDTYEHALQYRRWFSFVNLNVTVRDPEQVRDHALLFMLQIQPLDETRYAIRFAHERPDADARSVEVDTESPETFGRFSAEVIGAMLGWYRTGEPTLVARERAIGFTP